MRRRLALLALWVMAEVSAVSAQDFALKTNALYWATLTPNIGAEMSFSQKHSVQLFYGWNPWKSSSGKSIRHWVLQPEYRYWFCEAFNGWFVGAHAMGGQFNAGNVNLPFGMFDALEDHRYEGWYVGGGVTAGYQWMLSRHWNMEASLGLGYIYAQYDKYKCGECGDLVHSGHRHYVGPTKVALSFLYVF